MRVWYFCIPRKPWVYNFFFLSNVILIVLQLFQQYQQWRTRAKLARNPTTYPFLNYKLSLKVASVILGRSINDHIHLIFPHDPLAVGLISRPSKIRVSVGSLCSEIVTKNKWYYQPLKTKINGNANQTTDWGGYCGVLRCVHDSFYWMTETRNWGASWLCLFWI